MSSNCSTDRVTVRVLVCGDEPLMRAGLAALLATEPDVDVIGEADGGSDALAAVEGLQPDVALVETPLLCPDSMGATEELADAGGQAVKLVLLTTFHDHADAVEALRAGARGLLLRGCPPRELVHAIQVVAAGDALVMPMVVGQLLNQPTAALAPHIVRARQATKGLTARELEVLLLLAQGRSNCEMADDLSVGASTVRSHIHHLLNKLDLRNRAQAVTFAYETGLVRPASCLEAEADGVLASARETAGRNDSVRLCRKK